MKVLSLLQPWASLIFMGHKRIETRSWYTKHRGPILIHASKSNRMAKLVCGTDPFKKYVPDPLALPYGKILGIVNIVDVVTTEGVIMAKTISSGIITDVSSPHYWKLTDDEIAFGDYQGGRFAWLMKDIEEFYQPIPAKGSLSLWDYPIHEQGVICKPKF